jgi:hypothetical protein
MLKPKWNWPGTASGLRYVQLLGSNLRELGVLLRVMLVYRSVATTDNVSVAM